MVNPILLSIICDASTKMGPSDIAECVATGQTANLRSLFWELHWPLSYKIWSQRLISRRYSSQLRLCRCADWSGDTPSASPWRSLFKRRITHVMRGQHAAVAQTAQSHLRNSTIHTIHANRGLWSYLHQTVCPCTLMWSYTVHRFIVTYWALKFQRTV